MVQASIDPQAEERDWSIIKLNPLNRTHFRREWFCFRTFITLVMAEPVLDARMYQSFVDACFGTVAAALVDGATLQVRVTR
jgi:hypothetical protein